MDGRNTLSRVLDRRRRMVAVALLAAGIAFAAAALAPGAHRASAGEAVVEHHDAPAQAATQPPNASSEPQTPSGKAWIILREALNGKNVEKRAQAVRALGLLPESKEAETTAIASLKDHNEKVRLAAAVALGAMRARGAKTALEKALDDSQPAVALAAANALFLLNDKEAYDVYYAVLTGERRASEGLIHQQLATLRDTKKMAQLGFEEGIGFIPFAGIGYEVFKTVTRNDSSPVRAAAAKKLEHDPDPRTAEALVRAVSDKSFAVRAAALEAIAERGDKSLLPRITSALQDEKDVVRFAAAACVVRLSDLPDTNKAAKK